MRRRAASLVKPGGRRSRQTDSEYDPQHLQPDQQREDAFGHSSSSELPGAERPPCLTLLNCRLILVPTQDCDEW